MMLRRVGHSARTVEHKCDVLLLPVTLDDPRARVVAGVLRLDPCKVELLGRRVLVPLHIDKSATQTIYICIIYV